MIGPAASRRHWKALALASPCLLLAAVAVADPVTVTNFPSVQTVTGAVTVQNLPDVQKVTGELTVAGRTNSTSFVAFEDKAVVPTRKDALPRDYVSLGTIDATGFATITISLAAPLSTGRTDGGTLGIVLLPDVAVVRDAVERDNSMPFAIEQQISWPAGGASTATFTSVPLPLAFPRWRAYLYSRGSSTIRAHAFVMLGD